MAHGASQSGLRHFLTVVREYLTHWAIAGAIIALTGFAPDHWIADLFHHLAIPENLRLGLLQTFDIRIALVAVGVAIVGWDVLRRGAHRKREAVAVDGGAAIPASQHSVEKNTGDEPQPQAAATAMPRLPDKPSMAVLPFQNMSGDPEQDHFADGMSEDVITSLSKVRGLFVIARNSSFTYRNRAVDVRQGDNPANASAKMMSVSGPKRRFAAPPRYVRSWEKTGLFAYIVETALVTHNRSRLVNRRWIGSSLAAADMICCAGLKLHF